jgi:hypothetical protein
VEGAPPIKPQERIVLVEARKRYNGPIMLKKDRDYVFEVRQIDGQDQEWLDSRISTTAKGYERRRLNPFKRLRRHKTAKWFELVCETFGPANDPLECIPIGTGFELPAKANDRVMYCYANDVWHMYWNNRGAIELTIRTVDPG